jgi:hypothetical protein
MARRISGSHMAVVTIVPHSSQAMKKPLKGKIVAPKKAAVFESLLDVKSKFVKNKNVNTAVKN